MHSVFSFLTTFFCCLSPLDTLPLRVPLYFMLRVYRLSLPYHIHHVICPYSVAVFTPIYLNQNNKIPWFILNSLDLGSSYRDATPTPSHVNSLIPQLSVPAPIPSSSHPRFFHYCGPMYFRLLAEKSESRVCRGSYFQEILSLGRKTYVYLSNHVGQLQIFLKKFPRKMETNFSP